LFCFDRGLGPRLQAPCHGRDGLGESSCFFFSVHRDCRRREVPGGFLRCGLVHPAKTAPLHGFVRWPSFKAASVVRDSSPSPPVNNNVTMSRCSILAPESRWLCCRAETPNVARSMSPRPATFLRDTERGRCGPRASHLGAAGARFLDAHAGPGTARGRRGDSRPRRGGPTGQGSLRGNGTPAWRPPGNRPSRNRQESGPGHRAQATRAPACGRGLAPAAMAPTPDQVAGS